MYNINEIERKGTREIGKKAKEKNNKCRKIVRKIGKVREQSKRREGKGQKNRQVKEKKRDNIKKSNKTARR